LRRSLVTLTLLLVGGVVLLLGAVVVGFISAQDQQTARTDAERQQDRARERMDALAAELLALSQEVATGLSQAHGQRLRAWLEQEPLALYRDAEDPDRVDIQSIMNALVAEVRQRGREEGQRIAILRERMEQFSRARVEAVMSTERAEASRRAEAAAKARGDSLIGRLLLLLVGMAVLLALTLVWLVVGPVRRLRAAVDRIAEGDLATPVPLPRGGAEELVGLTQDVERMRDQIRAATQDLEAQVRRKTEDLASTLDERTEALHELRATQDRLVQAAKMAGLGTLAGGVAHEFNNLLGGILGCVEGARAGSTDASVIEDLDVAHKTAKRAAVLVQALLDVARPGTRALEPVDLAAVVDDVVRAAQPTASRRRIDIAREGDARPTVRGDEGQLHQVVLNLVTNAMQAVDDGERVVVAIREADGHGEVEVRDEGAGVPAEDRDRVFEPFFTSREDGTGLGLFVSYGIVERHGGRIEVGEAPEGGAAFRVRVPLAG
jgi:signal transduction histidine kinase